MNTYLTFKALHLIAVISWMAGLLYLPRIFVYHSETKGNKEQSETFKLMEKRLYLLVIKVVQIMFGFRIWMARIHIKSQISTKNYWFPLNGVGMEMQF